MLVWIIPHQTKLLLQEERIMASFKLGDLLIKEIMWAYASEPSTNGTGAPLYVLTQLSSATIDIASDSNDINDKNGNLVKRIYKSKTGTFQATNAFVNANIIQAASGAQAEFASSGSKIKFPKIVSGKPGTAVNISGAVTGTIKVNAYYGDGTMGEAVSSSAVTAAISGDTLTLPDKMGDADGFIVRFIRQVENGAVIRNNAEKFPSTVNMLLKCKYYDPCAKNTVKSLYVELPAFQAAPDTSLALSSDSTTMDFSGALEIDYCSIDKTLYNVYIPGDEEEEED